ncbi:hypothetical protein BGZ63DRAFT_409236 [Mariannaea sp. PMI_226]|nr:hypothetical protein BGZ63DRAFT_409236 [Mariannaea sp. PMI_226]
MGLPIRILALSVVLCQAVVGLCHLGWTWRIYGILSSHFLWLSLILVVTLTAEAVSLVYGNLPRLSEIAIIIATTWIAFMERVIMIGSGAGLLLMLASVISLGIEVSSNSLSANETFFLATGCIVHRCSIVVTHLLHILNRHFRDNWRSRGATIALLCAEMTALVSTSVTASLPWISAYDPTATQCFYLYLLFLIIFALRFTRICWTKWASREQKKPLANRGTQQEAMGGSTQDLCTSQNQDDADAIA